MNLSQLNQLPVTLQAMISCKNLAAGQILFTQSEPAAAIFILKSGQMQLVNYTEDGQQINHYSIRAGESFAEVVLFCGHYLCTAIANESSQVLVLPKEPFLMALKQDSNLATAYIEQLVQRLHENKILLELRSIRSAQKRVLHYLQLNVQADGITIHLDRPLKEIAENLGLTPEAVSRSLKQLDQEGKINRSKRKVVLRKKIAKLDSNHGDSNSSPINLRAT